MRSFLPRQGEVSAQLTEGAAARRPIVRRRPPPPSPSAPPPPGGGGAFATSASRLAGIAGALLGWRPEEFWRATPEELAVILAVFAPVEARAGADDLARLQERFPDG